MEKLLKVNQKKAKQRLKSKRKQPLKVVYIANPVKFKTSASEFRALVQELTGQYAEAPESSRYTMADGVCCGADAPKLVAQDNVRHDAREEVERTGHDGGEEMKLSDPFLFGSFDDIFCTTPQMMESFQEIATPSNSWH